MSSGDDRGRVYRWDLDKTYLRTEFDTIGDLIRTALEPATSKRSMPGATALLREIQRTTPRGIHILSGSPELMRGKLEAKLRHDGILWDSFVLKPTVEKLLAGNVRYVREQLGYKLRALLSSHVAAPTGADEILFGDDAEADAYVYSLYADLLARRVDAATLLSILASAGVDREDTEAILALAERAPRADAVRHVFIHLERVSGATAFAEFGPRVTAFYNYVQPALVLVEVGAIPPAGALRVGAAILDQGELDIDSLTASFDDLARRRRVGSALASRFSDEHAALVAAHATLAPFVRHVAESRLPPVEVPHPESLDYLALFTRDRARALAGKRRARFRGRLRT